MLVYITRPLQQQIFSHLEATWPNEGGGFLLGEAGAQGLRISESIAIENVFEPGRTAPPLRDDAPGLDAPGR